MEAARRARPGMCVSESATRLVTVERLVVRLGEVAPTITRPVPPRAMVSWWLMSRPLTEPSAWEELMSVGTWQMRFGTSMDPILIGRKRSTKSLM